MTQGSERNESQITEIGAQRLLAAVRAREKYGFNERQISELLDTGELDYFMSENGVVPEEIVKDLKDPHRNHR